jgi:amino acid adenylation domain-containing protein
MSYSDAYDPLDGIAIIGMAGRFPESPSVAALWQNLLAGRECVARFAPGELEPAHREDMLARSSPNYVRARGVLAGADEFDEEFFGFTPKEAEILDPQQRLFMQAAWEAIEHAGYDAQRFDGPIGVFAGATTNSYLLQNLLSRNDVTDPLGPMMIMLGNSNDYVATRVSYKFDLKGPALNIQNACSTSLVAVCTAVQSLQTYQCDMALAGGVSIMLPQRRGYLFQEGSILSPDGHCRAFDRDAAGTVSSNGLGIVVLRRLRDAIDDGDTIYAVIKGAALNNDGSIKVGFTAPSVDGQAEVISMAQMLAGIDPATISYIEAHGTGTALGDPIEIAGLTQAFRAGGAEENGFCAIGSIKSNIGHLDVAAGVAGLIKTTLALHHRILPASINFESPNPKLGIESTPFFVNAAQHNWPEGPTPRRAGVSSFGLGGTNAHVVIEEAPLAEPAVPASRSEQLLLLSARDREALDRIAHNLRDHLAQDANTDLADIAYTLQVGRRRFDHRRSIVCRNRDDAIALLTGADPKRVHNFAGNAEPTRVAFMFPGQGSQYVNMGRRLYESEPLFRDTIDECARMLRAETGVNLLDVIYPNESNRDSAQAKLTQTAITQPALFSIEYALAQLWMSWGVKPDAMIGHSIGEYVAACIGGTFSRDDALVLVARRARLMDGMPGGAMLGVRASADVVTAQLTPDVSIAAINAPNHTVVSGDDQAITAFEASLDQKDIAHRRLHTSHAYHSPMMEPALEPFAKIVAEMLCQTPQLRWISSRTGRPITDQEALDPHYWARQLRDPVQFARGVGELVGEDLALVEVGPGQTLAALSRQHDKRVATQLITTSLHPGQDWNSDVDYLLTAAGQLWARNVDIDWHRFHGDARRRRVALPTYPFRRRRHWVDPIPQNDAAPADVRPVSAAPHCAATAPTSVPAQDTTVVPTSRSAALLSRLKTVFTDLSGLDSAVLMPDVTFLEMGFDSLFLTQASNALQKQFATKITLHTLLDDAPTLNLLVERILPTLPDDALPTTTPVAAATPPPALATPAPKRSPTGGLTDFDPFAEVEAHFALTEPQREICAATLMGDDANCSYNQCFVLKLHGPLSVESLHTALAGIVRRHEALRISIDLIGESQHVLPEVAVALPVTDLATLDDREREAAIERIVDRETRTPFDLGAAPLWRAEVIREAPDRHQLVFTAHHVIVDGWSSTVLFEDLANLYAADRVGLQATLTPAASFRDFASDQQSPAVVAEMGAALDFWAAQYASGVPTFELPLDRTRPVFKTYTAGRQVLAIDTALFQTVRTGAAKQGATPFVALLAAFEVLVARLTSVDDFIIGVPMASQAMQANGHLVAHGVNTIPLRCHVDAEQTFTEHLRAVRRSFLAAQAHQRLTFGTLVQKLRLPRDPGRMPLVSITFNDKFSSPFDFGDVAVAGVETPRAFYNFELGLTVIDDGDSVVLECDFNADLFDDTTVARWLAHYRRLLAQVVAAPTAPLAALSLLTPAEHAVLVGEGPVPSLVTRDVTLHAGFARQVAATPEAIALIGETACGRVELSYAELDRRAEAVAAYLRTLGVGANQVVGLRVERSPDVVIGILAILKAGAAYLPLDPVYPTERVGFMLQDAAVRVVLTQRALADELAELPATCVCLDEPLPSAPAVPPVTPATGEDLAYVMYTSGSTGQPKGVRVTHRNVLRLFAATEAWFDFGPTDVWTLFHSFAFDFSVWELWGALLFGGRAVVVPHDTSRDPAAFRALVERERVTVLSQTPTGFCALIEADRAAPPGDYALRYIVFGGEVLQLNSLQPWFDRYGDDAPRVINMYGITETTVHSTYRRITRDDLADGKGSVIGVPIPDTRIYLLDAHGRPVPIGVVGELYIAGAGVADGYLNRPELTAARFVPDPFHGGRVYRSGDLARRLDDDELECLGRIDQQVKIRGFRVELGEIEAAIAQHPDIRQVAVIDREDIPGQKKLVAYLVAGTAPVTLIAELREALRARLPEYMVPAHFLYLDALPLTPNGKLDRKALPAPQHTPTEPREIVDPRSSSEALVVAVFNEALQRSDVGVFDNFFDLGGHSLMAARVMANLCETARVDLPLRNLFDRPTPEQLAIAIDAISWTAASSAPLAVASQGEREEIEV